MFRGAGQEIPGHDQGEPALCQVRLPRQASEAEAALWHDQPLLPRRRELGRGHSLPPDVVCGNTTSATACSSTSCRHRPATRGRRRRRLRLFRPGAQQPVPAGRPARKARSADRALDRPSAAQDAGSQHARAKITTLFMRMPAAQNLHHSYTSGLLEHVWSMARIASFLADHYAKYYDGLDPPLNRGLIVAAAILHDIGKLRELEYHPVEARYTKEGRLIGHVLHGPRHGSGSRAPGSTGFQMSCSCASSMRSWPITASESSAPRYCRQTLEALHRVVHRRPGCQGQHGGHAGRWSRKTAKRSPTRSSRSIIASSTAVCPLPAAVDQPP